MARRPTLAAHVFIVGFLAAQVTLIVTCYAREAKFFGWQMFSHGVLYRLAFHGVRPGGAREPLPTERTKALFLDGATRHWIGTTDRPRVFSRGDRFLLAEVRRLPAFFCGRLADLRYDRVDVEIEYQTPQAQAPIREIFSATCPGA